MSYVFVAILGLILGSFSSAITYRIPRSESWWSRDRSKCPHCGKTLSWRDLIPLVSYIMNKGKCRYCGAKISIRYPLIELTSALACLTIFFIFGLSLETLMIIALVPFLLSLLWIDLDHKILPDQLNLIAFMLGLLFVGLTKTDIIINHAIGMMIYPVLAWGLGLGMSKLLKKQALGFGDVKFFAVAGLWLGINPLPHFLILSGVLGVLLGVIWRSVKKEALFPFGPALIAAFFIILLINSSQIL